MGNPRLDRLGVRRPLREAPPPAQPVRGYLVRLVRVPQGILPPLGGLNVRRPADPTRRGLVFRTGPRVPTAPRETGARLVRQERPALRGAFLRVAPAGRAATLKRPTLFARAELPRRGAVAFVRPPRTGLRAQPPRLARSLRPDVRGRWELVQAPLPPAVPKRADGCRVLLPGRPVVRGQALPGRLARPTQSPSPARGLDLLRGRRPSQAGMKLAAVPPRRVTPPRPPSGTRPVTGRPNPRGCWASPRRLLTQAPARALRLVGGERRRDRGAGRLWGLRRPSFAPRQATAGPFYFAAAALYAPGASQGEVYAAGGAGALYAPGASQGQLTTE